MEFSTDDLSVGSQSRPPTTEGGLRKESILIRWMRMLRRSFIKYVPTKTIGLTLDEIERICMECVVWEDAKPYIDLLEKTYGKNAPQEVKDVINRVKERFQMLIYQKITQYQYFKMENVIVDGALYSIKDNINVNLQFNNDYGTED